MSDLLLEEKLLEDFDYVIGVDEVGRGAFAGPLCVSAFLLNKEDLKKIKENEEFLSVDDSKKVTKKRREKLSLLLKQFKYSISLRDNLYIDQYGLSKALIDSIEESVTELLKTLNISNKYIVLIDGNFSNKFSFNYKTVIDGDAKHFVISAASILAKVYRDNLMLEFSKIYPGYNLEKNVGYGTNEHSEFLKKLGITKIHRKSFEPIKKIIGH